MSAQWPKPHEVQHVRGAIKQPGALWVFSPKLNGFRALWDMHARAMFSRSRRKFAVPADFAARMPTMASPGFFLDGELVYDERSVAELMEAPASEVSAQANFERLNSIVRSGADTWRGVRFFCFDVFSDAPDKATMPLSSRLVMLRRIHDALPEESRKLFVLMPHFHYDAAHHGQYMAYAAKKGHEGIVMRDTASAYRDPLSMLKDRVFHEARGVVRGVVNNRGGTYLVVEPILDGNIGSGKGSIGRGSMGKGSIGKGGNDGPAARVRVANPQVTKLPAIDSTVTFRYHAMTPRGMYTNAVYCGGSSKI